MKGKNLLLLAIICLTYMTRSFTQDNSLTPFEGTYKGTLEIYQGAKVAHSLPMSLKILPVDSTTWTFHITYHRDGKEDFRPYDIRLIDAEKGHYVIDEHNGILLDSYLNGNCLYEQFAIDNSGIIGTTCFLDDNQLSYEMIPINMEATRISGDTIINGDTIPAVRSYQVYNTQKALLKRID
ncbi:MAG: hypothetical protein HRU41_15230 [Saprospiraceae bacterium]|nr:hypothetical protein [Saprospiraceae bacterium]